MRSSILSPPQPIKSKSKSYILTVFQKLLELKQITSLLRFTQRHAHSEVSSHRFVQWHLVHWVLTLCGLATCVESLSITSRSQLSQNQNKPKHFYALSFSGKNTPDLLWLSAPDAHCPLGN